MRILFILVFVCGLFASIGMAVQAADATYHLGPEDAFIVTVLKHPEFSGDFLVPPDGVVDLPAVGRVTVTGKTLDELTAHVVERLKERLQRPEVTITLKTLRMQRIYVLGAVANPSVFDLKPGWRITEALAAAGGVKGNPVECKASLLRGATGERTTVDLPAVLSGSPAANLALAPGDVLTVDSVELFPVYVTGEVKQPGLCQLRAGSGVVEALAQVGGLTLPEGDVQAMVMRNGQDLARIDFSALANGDAKANIPLASGDVVKVDARRGISIMVAGRVEHPGPYQIKQGEGVIEALTLAGGSKDDAALMRVMIVRNSGVSETVDVASILREGKNTPNARLSIGDLVVVPQRMARIAVFGYVNKPGYFELQEGKPLRLADALSLAQGPENIRSGLSSVALLRTTDGKQQRLVFNLEKFLKRGDISQNPEIAEGDIIYVPETKKPDWQQIFRIISSIGVTHGIFF